MTHAATIRRFARSIARPALARAPALHLALVLLLALAPAATAGESGPEIQAIDMPVDLPRPALLGVEVPGEAAAERLRRLGLDVIDERPGRSARVLGWPGTTAALDKAGFRYSLLEPDFGAALLRASGRPPQPLNPLAPATSPPLGQGSMAGYHTLAEIDAFLADLVANDPNGIVGSITQIGTSRQGRPIKALRIAKEAFPDHSRPRVLITSLHHAREPIGMQAVLEFMRRLVTDYGVDPNITYLVDRREIWFVPVVNPDGYVLNETTYSHGSFGMWRKNARDNDGNGTITGQDGVDINRNYSYRWAYDDIGSSGYMSNPSYRGTSAFSEPETRAIRDLCVAHQFSTADNFHTYAEACLYPWGYVFQSCADSMFFARMAEDMTRDNAYGYGPGSTQLYRTNGEASDWFYGDVTTKPRCFAVTTEVGDQNDNFWPPADRIPVLAAQQVRSNIVLAYSAGPYVRAESSQIVSADGYLHPGGSAQVALTLRHSGLVATTGAVQVTVTTTAPGVTVTDAVSTFPALSPGATAMPSGGDLLGFSTSSSIPPGTLVPLVLTITDQGNYVLRDTTSVIVGVPVTLFSDDASNGLGNWIVSSNWGLQDRGGDLVFSDSPAGLYATLTSADLTRTAPLSLLGTGHAWLTFNTSYDIEGEMDSGRVQLSTDGGASWTSLTGRLTRPGHGTTGPYTNGTQGLGEPVYAGTQRIEATEWIDLTPWTGLTDIRLRFRLLTDDTGRKEGWFVDDIRVLAYPNDSVGVPEDLATGPRPSLTPAFPNPFQGGTRLSARFTAPTVFSAAVYSADGRLVRPLAEGMAPAGSRDIYWDGRLPDGRSAASGAYFVRLQWDGGSVTRRVTRIR